MRGGTAGPGRRGTTARPWSMATARARSRAPPVVTKRATPPAAWRSSATASSPSARADPDQLESPDRVKMLVKTRRWMRCRAPRQAETTLARCDGPRRHPEEGGLRLRDRDWRLGADRRPSRDRAGSDRGQHGRWRGRDLAGRDGGGRCGRGRIGPDALRSRHRGHRGPGQRGSARHPGGGRRPIRLDGQGRLAATRPPAVQRAPHRACCPAASCRSHRWPRRGPAPHRPAAPRARRPAPGRKGHGTWRAAQPR